MRECVLHEACKLQSLRSTWDPPAAWDAPQPKRMRDIGERSAAKQHRLLENHRLVSSYLGIYGYARPEDFTASRCN